MSLLKVVGVFVEVFGFFVVETARDEPPDDAEADTDSQRNESACYLQP